MLTKAALERLAEVMGLVKCASRAVVTRWRVLGGRVTPGTPKEPAALSGALRVAQGRSSFLRPTVD